MAPPGCPDFAFSTIAAARIRMLSAALSVIDNITIGVGAAVVDDLTEPGVYVGVPAKLLKRW